MRTLLDHLVYAELGTRRLPRRLFAQRDASNFAPYFHPDVVFQNYGDGEARSRDNLVTVYMLDASTLTHGPNDSPIGMLAWLLQRWKKWSDKNNGGFACTATWSATPGHRCATADPWSNPRPASPPSYEERVAAFENGPTRAMFNVVNVNAHHEGGHSDHYEKLGPTSATSARPSARRADLTEGAATPLRD